MDDKERAEWEARTAKYARRFGWWWRGEGWERAVAAYRLTPLEYQSPENCKTLWNKIRWAAFNYERYARREHGRKLENGLLYEYKVCFCDLERSVIETLLMRWPGDFVVEAKTHKRLARASLLDEQAQPSDTDLALLDEQRRNDERPYSERGSIKEHISEMLESRARLTRLLTNDGWSIPRWMRFDLRAKNDEICQDFRRWLNEQRKARNIPEPRRHANVGTARRTEKAGPSFRQIEDADLYANLPPKALNELKVDQSNARKFIKKSLQMFERDRPAK